MVFIDELEEALVDEESVALADIFARLLRYVTGSSEVLISNFDTFLRNLLIKENAVVPHFLDNGTTWQDLTPEEKLSTLKWLIDHVYQEKEEDIGDYLDENYSADELRGICAGQDAFNNIYWYLDDLRLYREYPHKKQSKKGWECVCLTLADWNSFIKQFRKTSNVQEKELYTYLNFELFPIVELELLNKKKVVQTKEEAKKYLIKREQQDLKVMLEKKTFLECSNGIKSDINGGETISHEKHNGAVLPVKSLSGNDISEFLMKSEENCKGSTMNICDGHLSISESVCSISNSLNCSTMDTKPSSVTNMCTNSCSKSCSTSCGNPLDTCTVSSNGSCGNGNNCISSASASTPVLSSQDIKAEANLPQSLSDTPSDSSSVTSNKENAPPSSGNSANDIPPMSAMSNMVVSTSTPATTASVQPLPSNMVNKTSFQMDTQYMQQQSQIFVFSTALANKAAESFLSQQFPSIIAFHCAQPGTKSFLEKYPLKVQQFNRQNPAAWLNTLAQMKQSGRQMKNPVNQFPSPHNPNGRFPCPSGRPLGAPCAAGCNMHGPNMCSMPRGPSYGGSTMGPAMPNEMCPQSWPGQQFGPGASSSSMNPRFPGPMAEGINVRQMGPSGSPLLGCMGNMNPNSGNTSFPNPTLNEIQMIQGSVQRQTLSGVKVPDENLTPQQRQHREEQLAMIRKMQQLLFPEQQPIDPEQSGMGPNLGPVMGDVPLQHGQQPRFGPGDMCVHPGMDTCFSPHQACMNEHQHPHPSSDMYMGSNMMGPGFPQQNFPPSSVSAQLEWQKLQHQFFEDRRKKQVCGNTPVPHPTSTPVGPQTSMPQPSQQALQTQQSMSQPQTPQQQNLNSPSPSLGLSPGTRMQGPPPPYHQTTRRAMPSPHPASPNTSSLSLPSPRMASGLPSPADSARQFPHPTPPGSRLPHPSPGSATPAGSSSLHTTPLNSPKPLNTSGPGSNSGTLTRTPTTPSNTASTPVGTPTSSCAPMLTNSGPGTPAGSCSSNRKQNQPCSGDLQDSNSVGSVANTNSEFLSSSCTMSTPNNTQEMFCHNMHSCSQPPQKQDQCTSHGGICQKEPSLMPVPSPQQIQYLNAFDGQELTIQKQPNTTIRDLDMMSPASMPPSMVMSAGSHSQFQSPDAASFPNTPGSCPSALENSQDSLSGRYPSSAPASMEGMQRFTAPSPQMPGFDGGPRYVMPGAQMGDNSIPRFPNAQNLDMMRIPGPHSMGHSPMDDSVVRFPGPGPQGPMFGPGSNGSMNSMARFPNSATEAMQRFRGPSPHTNMDIVHSRFMGTGPHMSCVENMAQQSQFNNVREAMPQIPSQNFPNSAQTMNSRSSPCVNNFMIDGGMSHSHLQNLQKMTPPFENMTGNKVSSDVMSPMPQCSNSSVNGSNINMPPYGEASPLTSSSQVSTTQRLSHFDPIASMAAMSESTVPLVTAGATAQTHQDMTNSNMNMTNMQVACSSGGGNQPAAVNFHSNMQSMQNVMQSSVACTMSNQYAMHTQMAHNAGCRPQTVNNTYVNANMSIQQLNIQNVVTTASYNVGGQGPNMNPHSIPANCQGNGANTISCSVTTNHPIMHTAVTTRTTNANIVMTGPRLGPQNFPGQSLVQRNVSPANAGSPTLMVRGAPFNSTNIQVKANAPNTIQYLPARQQSTAPASNRPPTLEFLQRFAAPLTNLDNKVPTHNLQYFPNSGGNNAPTVHTGVGMNPASGNVAPGMMNSQRPVNIMMGPMMRGASPNVSHPNNQMYPVGSGLPGQETPMFGRPPCPSVTNQMIPMNAMSGGQGVAMFSNKQMPLPMGGMAPEATQPLPPSMGQSFNYKQSPFYGPTTADPNYAVQFHNFQQQLYATNTRASQMTSQTNMGGQGFFGPK
ncbi:protein BCL9 homolog [Uloborus diversus]|uniref:protein BCL9 homolog n=1 Tax=Uloborus diversus TaxID=327109 RepID=UPI002409CF61|nr:protein BCL9 homolog [Uloborus diversus]